MRQTRRRNTRRVNSNTHNKTHKKYIDKLQRLYPACKHDINRDDYSRYEGHRITYGEMEYDGIEQLYQKLIKINPKIDCFMDIGSGRGKLCMYMAAKPKIKSVLGIELVEQRHNDALILKSELKSEYSRKVDLLNSDIFNIDLTEYSGKNVFIWFSNLCFDQNITDKIFEKIIKEIPAGSFVCCSKEPAGFDLKKEPQSESEKTMEKIDEAIIPMSWSQNSNVFI